MSFTGNEGGTISLSTAAAMTLSFRTSITNILTGLLNPLFPLTHVVDKDNLQGLLDQTNCVGVRIYHGAKTLGQRTVVLVGADSSENDLYSGIILDEDGESITLTAAATLTHNYRTLNSNILTGVLNSGVILSNFTGKNNVQDLLDQDDCVRVRIYHGIDTYGKKSPILLGVNNSEEDMSDGMILDQSASCPPICAIANALNSIVG